MKTSDGKKKLLLISNSTLHGRGYLDHVEHEIREIAPSAQSLVFVPYALYDRRAYATLARERFRKMGIVVTSIHDVSNMARTIAEAGAIFVGGGNTFRLLKSLYDHNLLEPIRQTVAAGVPYIGSSAGSIIACPTLKTTKDMPVVQPPSFEALGFVNFQVSPHYLDPDPTSTHMGETQEERIKQFLEENEGVVVGLREGSFIRVQDGSVILKGANPARIFRGGEEPIELKSGSDLSSIINEPVPLEGRVA
jgi:dipeptidase E